MTPERESRIKEIFRAAIERDEASRASFLEQACGSEPDVRREVEHLLREQAGSSHLRTSPEDPGLVGRTVSHYEVLEQLGAGGMGVVYKARDNVLKRHVALKVLPPTRRRDPESRSRFVREAQAASALNHPNIAAVHDILEHEGVDFIVMEYVEGETLDRLIPASGMGLPEVLTIGIRIAEALEAAHGAGIIHRDLKPANVMVSDRSFVKVLDFGVAKLMEPSESGNLAATVTQEPVPLTVEGAILGTVSHMSPEQAEGKRIDTRSDIFSFGSLLYEMITGRRAFRGETPMSTLVAVIHEEPEGLEELPSELGRIVRRCLRKEPERRFQHMSDVIVELREVKEETESGRRAAAATASVGRAPGRRRVWYVAAAVLGFGVVAAGVWVSGILGPSEVPAGRPLEAVPLTTFEGSETSPTFSPDGNQVAYSWNGESRDNFDIYVQVIGSGSPLRLTKDPAMDTAPAWSPDGRYIAFLRSTGMTGEGAVYLIPPLGGAERKLAEGIYLRLDETYPTKMGWSPDAKTLYLVEWVGEAQGIYSISVGSGEKHRLTSPPPLGDYSLAVSTDGQNLAFGRVTASLTSALYVASVHGGTPRHLTGVHGSASVAWMPDGKEIVFASTQAAGFTPSLWKIAAAGGTPIRLAILGEGGVMPVVSPTGRRLIYEHRSADVNIWRYDRPESDGIPWRRTKLIASTQMDQAPQISPDGRRIVFSSLRSGSRQIWVASSDGSNQFQLTSLEPMNGSPRWSPDGRMIAFDGWAKGTCDIYVIDSQGGSPRPLVVEEGTQSRPSWSRDGKWIYFNSDHTGKEQIWKVPAGGGKPVQLTREGGRHSFESADGRFVYYQGAVGADIWRVPAEGGEEVAIDPQRSPRFDRWALSADGIYFAAEERDASSRSKWVLRWFHFDTQEVAVVSNLDKPPYGATPIDVSPDGKWFICVHRDRYHSDLMLVENFR